jgi:hypothetical protein
MAAAAKSKSVKVKDLTLKLPAKLPFVTVRYVNENNVEVAPLLEAILGADQAEKVWGLGLDVDEGAALVDEIIGKYGVDTGK